jgi:predicted double-glycine peptidase
MSKIKKEIIEREKFSPEGYSYFQNTDNNTARTNSAAYETKLKLNLSKITDIHKDHATLLNT